MTNAPTTHQAENMIPLHPVERGDHASRAQICKSRAFYILRMQAAVLYLFCADETDTFTRRLEPL